MVSGCVLVRSFLERAACYSSTISDRVFFFFFPPQPKVESQSSINRGNRYSSLYRGTDYLSRTASGSALDRITDYTRLPLLIARQCPVGWIPCTFGARERGMSEALFSEWGREGGGESMVERGGYSRGLPRIDLIWCLPTLQFPLCY